MKPYITAAAVLINLVSACFAISFALSFRHREVDALARSLVPTSGVDAITALATDNGYSNITYVVVFEREHQEFCCVVRSNNVSSVRPVRIKIDNAAKDRELDL
jgi:hypothetical protein